MGQSGMRRGWDVFDGPEEVTWECCCERHWLGCRNVTHYFGFICTVHGPYEGSAAMNGAVPKVVADSMLAPLKRLQLRQAMVLVTSDHGEVLDEEGAYQHERSF